MRPTRSTIVVFLVWNLVVVPSVVVCAVTESAWALVPVAIVAGALSLTWVLRTLGRRTGHNAVEPESAGSSQDRATIEGRWIGGGSIPHWVATFNAPSPMTVLEVRRGLLSMRLRPTALAVAFGVKPLNLSTRGLDCASPVRGWLRVGVALTPVGSAPHIFWTLDVEDVLGALERAGFTVTREWQKPGVQEPRGLDA